MHNSAFSFFLFLLFTSATYSQADAYRLVQTFTTADGLPSNHLYKITEDSHGFLWVSTDAGVARFDGRYFQTFTTVQGLPDNEVLSIVKEKDGTLWVNCFRKVPAYFDEKLNRFVVPKIPDTILKKMNGLLMYLHPLKKGGVMYSGQHGASIFRNKTITDLSGKGPWDFVVKEITTGELIRYKTENNGHNTNYVALRHEKDNKVVDSVNIYPGPVTTYKLETDGDNFNLTNYISGKHYIFSNFQLNPLRFTLDSISVNEPLYYGSTTDRHIALIGRSGKVYFFDKGTKKLIQVFQGGYSPNYAYKDKSGNIWVSTIDKGLLLYKATDKTVTALPTPSGFEHTHFISIARQGQTILAGNHYAEVLSVKNNQPLLHIITKAEGSNWVRKIISVKDKVYTFSEGGSFINYQQVLLNLNKKQDLSVKAAILLNDSTIIYGMYVGLVKIDTRSEKQTPLHTPQKRVTSITSLQNRFIYFGSTDGLYKYEIATDTGYSIQNKHSLFAERIVSLSSAPEGLLLAGTTDKGLLVIQNDKLLAQLTIDSGLLSNNILSLAPCPGGKIFCGTDKGLNIINYTYTGNSFSTSVQSLTTRDGLTGNTVNEMLYSNDTVYAATSNGVSAIPVSIRLPNYDIPVQLTGVKINNRDTIISSSYTLPDGYNNFQLHLAGIETGGHWAMFEYAVNNSDWLTLQANVLNLELGPGKHLLQVRAVDINGHTGTRILKIDIEITIPFWRKAWFWGILIALAAMAAMWWYSRQRLLKQKRKAAQLQALEQQRHKITADLHDDIGATLSSLQLNSGVAKQLMIKDSTRAKQVMEKIEEQSKELSEKISDIIWSMKPGKEEFMGLSSRIKNFAHNILGHSAIQYTVDTDKELDTLVQDITVRKNIILIAKEAINNAVKHSGASHISIALQKENSTALLLIQDNGSGIAPERSSGNGIGNMQKRAAEINSRFTIETDPKTGTVIRLQVPVVT
jgi:signal transduction histidine kinase/ligand-binding sensor domain-containing protein